MVLFVVAILLVLVGIGFLLARRKFKDEYESAVKEYEESDSYYRKRPEEPVLSLVGNAPSYVLLGVAAVFIFLSCIYAQDVGEVVVVRNLGGSVAGHTEEAGFHLKAPWQDSIAYDTRNNLVNFYGDEQYSYDGGSAKGPDVTVNDKSGAAADIDIQVNYSIDPSIAEYLYSEYGTQTTFTTNYVSNDLRSVAREVSGRFDTITMLTDRSQFTSAVQETLTSKWEDLGVTVEQVSVQDVRYPDEITAKYAEAQAAEIAKATAENQQKVAEVEAQTKVIQAQGEAEANATLSASLTEEVIQQHYIDALKSIGESGNLVVVPEGSMPLIGTNQ